MRLVCMRALFGNFWCAQPGRQCVKSRMCFHRVLLLNCFASVYTCDFQRMNECVCEKQVGGGFSSERTRLPLWTQWEASSRFFLFFYGRQTAGQLKLCTSQMIRKELTWRCDTPIASWVLRLFSCFNSMWCSLLVKHPGFGLGEALINPRSNIK